MPESGRSGLRHSSVVADVRVQLLGPVGLEVDGRAVTLGAQLRLILAVLALARGRAVPRDRLAELAWGEPVPAAAAATLRSHVAHLRRIVEPDRPSGGTPLVVVTEPHGYALRLPPDRIDAVCFERLLTAAREALRAGDPAAASAGAAQALRLWRAPALADLVDRSFAVAEAARLDGLRDAARRVRVTAEVELGRYEDVLPELRELVAADPADERLRRVLALALFHGHQRDAAAGVCADGLRLAARRGMDAPALQALQTDILRGAPTLERAAPRPRPFQLPPDATDFTGRAAELAAVTDRLDGALADGLVAPVVAVDGKPGIGKSALIVRLAHWLAPRFPDGVLYVNLRGAEPHQLTPSDALGRFLTALGVSQREVPDDEDAASAALRTELMGRRLLMVLDNAADAAQVRPLLPAAPGCAALVTSRRPLVDLDVTLPVTLDLLTVTEAVDLLGRLAGRERVAAEPDAAAEVARHCGLLPLAVRIAGARLRARPSWAFAAFAARLADQHRRLAELAVGDLAVLSSFRLGYRALAPADAQLFRLLGLLDAADFEARVAAAVADRRTVDAEAALERLVDAQLVEAHRSGRYRFHDLLRLFARECAAADEDPGAPEAALARGLAWYERTTRRAAERIRQVSDGPGPRPPADDHDGRDHHYEDEHAALAWLDDERANLVSAARQAAEQPRGDVAWLLDEVLLHYFNARKRWSDWHAVASAALAAAVAADDGAAMATAHRHLGMIAAQRLRSGEARDHLLRALRLFEDLGDGLQTAKLHCDLGIVYTQLGEYDASLVYLTRALAASRVVGLRAMEGVVLNNLALLHVENRDHDAALGCIEATLAIEVELGGTERSATLESLGTIHLRQDRFGEAAAAYRRSLAAARSVGDRWSEAHALRGLGVATGERPYLRHALDIFRALGAPEAGDVERLLDEPRPAVTPGRHT